MSMITLDDLQRGVAAYLDNEFMPNFSSNGLERVVVGTAIGLIIKKNFGKIASLKDNAIVKMTGVMDENANIDLDILATEVKANMPAEGIQIEAPMIGMLTFKTDDIDKLQQYIKGGK